MLLSLISLRYVTSISRAKKHDIVFARLPVGPLTIFCLLSLFFFLLKYTQFSVPSACLAVFRRVLLEHSVSKYHLRIVVDVI